MFKKFKNFCCSYPKFSLIFFPTVFELFITLFLWYMIGFSLIHHYNNLAIFITLFWQFSFGLFSYFFYYFLKEKIQQIKKQKKIYSIKNLYSYYSTISHNIIEQENKTKEMNL